MTNSTKFLEENIGRTLSDKWKLLKLKSFYTAKETINKTKKTTHRFGEDIYK